MQANLQANSEQTKEKVQTWADSWCVTRWQKPQNDILIWKKLSLEKSLENLELIANFILKKENWLKMYSQMLEKLTEKLEEKSEIGSKRMSESSLENGLETLEKTSEIQNSEQSSFQSLQKITELKVKIENLEQEYLKTKSSETGENLELKTAENNLIKTDQTDSNWLVYLHQSVLLEFWRTGNLEFWAIICGEFWESEIKNYLAENDKKLGDYLWPLRVGLSGQKQSPSPFEILACLGYLETQKRLQICINAEK